MARGQAEIVKPWQFLQYGSWVVRVRQQLSKASQDAGIEANL